MCSLEQESAMNDIYIKLWVAFMATMPHFSSIKYQHFIDLAKQPNQTGGRCARVPRLWRRLARVPYPLILFFVFLLFVLLSLSGDVVHELLPSNQECRAVTLLPGIHSSLHLLFKLLRHDTHTHTNC